MRWPWGRAELEVDTPATIDSDSVEFTSAFGTLFFSADDGRHGVELWKSDGTEGGTSLVRDIALSTHITFPSSTIETPREFRPEGLTAVGDEVFFRVTIDGESAL
jgi:ELWxxDGT repeat protein